MLKGSKGREEEGGFQGRGVKLDGRGKLPRGGGLGGKIRPRLEKALEHRSRRGLHRGAASVKDYKRKGVPFQI